MTQKRIVFHVVYKRQASNGNVEARVEDFYDCMFEYDNDGQIARVHAAGEFNADGVNGWQLESRDGKVFPNRADCDYAVRAYRQGKPRLDVFVGRFPNQMLLNPHTAWAEEVRGIEVLVCTSDSHEAYRVSDNFNATASRAFSPTPPPTYIGGMTKPSSSPIDNAFKHPNTPYSIETDHGSINVDPNAPYYDPSSGESGRWVNPAEPPIQYPDFGGN